MVSAEWRCKYSCSAFRWFSTIVMVSSSTSLISGGGGGAGMLRGVSRLSKHSGLVWPRYWRSCSKHKCEWQWQDKQL